MRMCWRLARTKRARKWERSETKAKAMHQMHANAKNEKKTLEMSSYIGWEHEIRDPNKEKTGRLHSSILWNKKEQKKLNKQNEI